MSDLDKQIEAVRERAHKAPRCLNEDGSHTGGRAWADASREYFRLLAIKRATPKPSSKE